MACNETTLELNQRYSYNTRRLFLSFKETPLRSNKILKSFFSEIKTLDP